MRTGFMPNSHVAIASDGSKASITFIMMRRVSIPVLTCG